MNDEELVEVIGERRRQSASWGLAGPRRSGRGDPLAEVPCGLRLPCWVRLEWHVAVCGECQQLSFMLSRELESKGGVEGV